MSFENRPDREDEVVLVGRSNVGKSTLMRELTGHSFDTGGTPGVTRQPNHYDWAGQDFMFTDLPGFGFMSGVEEGKREQIKTDVVRYVEENADDILAGVLVVDGKAVIDIIDRHRGNGDIPHDVEMFHFLQDVGIDPIVAVNKMDKVDDRDERLDDLCDRLGLFPPWQQYQETI
jgi:small GTP-binding protein